MYAKTITILGDVPSKKNSKQILFNRCTKRPFIASSKAFKEWERYALLQLNKYRGQFDQINTLTARFFPSHRRRFDLSNKFESIADALVDAGILKDDNYEVLGRVVLEFGGIDKQNPRTEVFIEN